MLFNDYYNPMDVLVNAELSIFLEIVGIMQIHALLAPCHMPLCAAPPPRARARASRQQAIRPCSFAA